MTETLGFIGLGMMGLPMLENLARGWPGTVFAYDRSAAPLDQLTRHEAWGKRLRAAASITDMAVCDIVITMLPNSKITNAVIAGTSDEAGLATILKRGATVIDMGSSNPADTIALAATLRQAGITLIDAPVSGAVAKARTGTLAIMAGGQAHDIDRVREVLQRIGSTLISTGAVGSAHAMKALNNYVYAAGLLAASEALLIAQAMKLDPSIFTEVLNASSGRNVATETKLEQFVIPRTFNAGFALSLMAKDLATANSLQDLTGVEAPQLSLCAQLWRDAIGEMSSTADNTEIYRYLEERKTA